jgi:transcriptional regulator with XRE-family HTH domain
VSKRLSPGQQRAATLLRNARAESGLSLRELACELGMNPSMRARLNAWELGRRPVSVANLEKILNACGRELVIASKGAK